MVGASVQYTVNRETRDVRLQSSSARTQNAVLHALDNMRMPGHLSKADLVSAFSETFRIILPDTPSLLRSSSTGWQGDETEMDAIDSLCGKLNDRQIVHRVSDRELMHNMSEIIRNIEILDDLSGHFKTRQPRLYTINCSKCHFVGESQLRSFENVKLPVCTSSDNARCGCRASVSASPADAGRLSPAERVNESSWIFLGLPDTLID